MQQYDIFISYRRDGGEQSAKAIYDHLKRRGYKVFLDVETLRSGAFNTQLYSVIEQCRDMIVILSPNSLDRCVNEDDWVRLEIAHALRHKKNVIPVMLRDFVFPVTLPADIDQIRYQNGIQASVEFFDAFMDKLCTFFNTMPSFASRILHPQKWHKTAIIVACVLFILAGVLGGLKLLQKPQETGLFPRTQEERIEFEETIAYVKSNLSIMDLIFYELEGALNDCESYIINGARYDYLKLSLSLEKRLERIESAAHKLVVLSPELKKALNGSGINLIDLEGVSRLPTDFAAQYVDTIRYLDYVTDPQVAFDKATLKSIIDANKEMVKFSSGLIFSSICKLLIPMDENALYEFRINYLPTLQIFSRDITYWSRDMDALYSYEENLIKQLDNVMLDYAAIVGNINMDMIETRSVLISALVDEGYSRFEAEAYVDRLMGKAQSVAELKAQVEKDLKELQALKAQVKEQCKPDSNDDPMLTWSKALRLLTVKLYDDAIDVFQFYLLQVKDADPAAQVYVPSAIRFVRSIGQTGIDFGVVVAGYDPNRSHDIYQIGDIIIALNGNPVRNMEDYIKLREEIGAESAFEATLLRSDVNGDLQVVDVEVPLGQPKVFLMELNEN